MESQLCDSSVFTSNKQRQGAFLLAELITSARKQPKIGKTNLGLKKSISRNTASCHKLVKACPSDMVQQTRSINTSKNGHTILLCSGNHRLMCMYKYICILLCIFKHTHTHTYVKKSLSSHLSPPNCGVPHLQLNAR